MRVLITPVIQVWEEAGNPISKQQLLNEHLVFQPWTGAKFSYCPAHLPEPPFTYKPITYESRTKQFSCPGNDIFADGENHNMVLCNLYFNNYGAGAEALGDLKTFVGLVKKIRALSSTILLQNTFRQVKNLVYQQHALTAELAMPAGCIEQYSGCVDLVGTAKWKDTFRAAVNFATLGMPVLQMAHEVMTLRYLLLMQRLELAQALVTRKPAEWGSLLYLLHEKKVLDYECPDVDYL